MAGIKVLLVGASGLVGRECLRQLLKDDDISEVEIWVRRPIALNNPKLVEWLIDFEKISVVQKTNADVILCCLGTTIKKAKTQTAFVKVDYDYPLALAIKAQQEQVKHFSLVSSIGADSSSKNFYLRTKGQLEEAISGLDIPSISILRPSILLGKRKEFRLWESIAKQIVSKLEPLLTGNWKKYRGTQAKLVAELMIIKAKAQIKGVEIIESEQIK